MDTFHLSSTRHHQLLLAALEVGSGLMRAQRGSAMKNQTLYLGATTLWTGAVHGAWLSPHRWLPPFVLYPCTEANSAGSSALLSERRHTVVVSGRGLSHATHPVQQGHEPFPLTDPKRGQDATSNRHRRNQPLAGKSGRKIPTDQGCSEANEKRFSGNPPP